MDKMDKMDKTPVEIGDVLSDHPSQKKKGSVFTELNPLTWVGATLVSGAGIWGIYSFVRSNDGLNSNKAMRLRVVGQGIAVASVTAFGIWHLITQREERQKYPRKKKTNNNH